MNILVLVKAVPNTTGGMDSEDKKKTELIPNPADMTALEEAITLREQVGGTVTVNCFLRQVDGRRLVFAVEASDKGGIIGRGSHERFIVDNVKFQAKCDKKKEN